MQINNQVVITFSSEETRLFGVWIGKSLKKGDIITLYGDLGNGKTTFTQGLAEGLGIKKRIISPTFTIVRTYELKSTRLASKRQTQNAKIFYHIDLYRTNSIDDIKGLGFEEILNDKTAVIAIEWAEKLGALLPKKRIDVHFEYVDENRRKISVAVYE